MLIIIRKIYSFLSSSKLAMALLIAILVCCVLGVTIYRGERAWRLIFNTLWFNGILVLLVVNVVFCFFPRMWRRRLTLVSFGMILFHLSFVAILAGIIFNSQFYFRGLIRLTEGETLPSNDPMSYDYFNHGRFFSFVKLKGETNLIRMHKDYKVEGANKRAAYEIAVGERGFQKQGILYITQSLDNKGFTYLNEKEGYSPLVIISDKNGRELYRACVAFQSIKQKNGTYLYTTGSKEGPGSFPFPQEPAEPVFLLQVAYYPDTKKERAGDIFFQVWPFEKSNVHGKGKPAAEGKVAIGEKFKASDYYLEVEEIRYWVGMNVRHEPGRPVVLSSLWVGLAGMIITFIGRMRKGRRRAVSDQ